MLGSSKMFYQENKKLNLCYKLTKLHRKKSLIHYIVLLTDHAWD